MISEGDYPVNTAQGENGLSNRLERDNLTVAENIDS